jgi:hypothetical protein
MMEQMKKDAVEEEEMRKTMVKEVVKEGVKNTTPERYKVDEEEDEYADDGYDEEE